MNRKQIQFLTAAAISTISSAAFAAMTAPAPAAPTFAPRAGVAPAPIARPSEVAPPVATKGAAGSNVVYPKAFNNRIQQEQQAAKAANENTATATASAKEQNSCPAPAQMYANLTQGTSMSAGRVETLVQAGEVQVAANDCGAAVEAYSPTARQVLFETADCAFDLPAAANANAYIDSVSACQAKAKNHTLGTNSATAATERANVIQEATHCSLFPKVKVAYQQVITNHQVGAAAANSNAPMAKAANQ